MQSNNCSRWKLLQHSPQDLSSVMMIRTHVPKARWKRAQYSGALPPKPAPFSRSPHVSVPPLQPWSLLSSLCFPFLCSWVRQSLDAKINSNMAVVPGLYSFKGSPDSHTLNLWPCTRKYKISSKCSKGVNEKCSVWAPELVNKPKGRRHSNGP